MTIQIQRKQDEYTVTITEVDDPGSTAVPAAETFHDLKAAQAKQADWFAEFQ